MKNIWIALLLCLSLGTVCLAAEKVEAPDSCKICGMNRTMFGYSRMVVTYADGSSSGTCSLNCVATEMKTAKGKKVKSFQVADYNNRKLTDAKKATWVIGGRKKGVMTQMPKWAFADRKDAAAFIKENGGKLATFDEALKAAMAENSDENGHNMHMH